MTMFAIQMLLYHYLNWLLICKDLKLIIVCLLIQIISTFIQQIKSDWFL